jgi:hypothetical protein
MLRQVVYKPRKLKADSSFYLDIFQSPPLIYVLYNYKSLTLQFN